MKFPRHLPRKRASGGAGDTRNASRTPFRNSRAHDWFNAITVQKRKAVQINPPAIRRASSTEKSKVKLKMTTTSKAKNSMEFSTSRERHSSRRSLVTFAQVKAA